MRNPISFASAANRKGEELPVQHAMHLVHGYYLPMCGAQPITWVMNFPRPTKKLCGKCSNILKAQILNGMARAFFASAWADQCEECGHSAMLSGKDIMDLLPKRIDPAALHAAKTLQFDMERKHGKPIAELFAANPGKPEGRDKPLTAERWGHYAAMQAMGHGVGLWEWGIDLEIPYCEFGSHSLERDYFQPVDSTNNGADHK